MLTTPVVLWSDTRLTLGPGERLDLSRPDGAFLINFGQLVVDGGTIAAVGDRNEHSRPFVPFVTTADGGTVALRNAHDP